MSENPYEPPQELNPPNVVAAWSVRRWLVLLFAVAATIAIWYVTCLAVFVTMHWLNLPPRSVKELLPGELAVIAETAVAVIASIPAVSFFFAALLWSRRCSLANDRDSPSLTPRPLPNQNCLIVGSFFPANSAVECDNHHSAMTQ